MVADLDHRFARPTKAVKYDIGLTLACRGHLSGHRLQPLCQSGAAFFENLRILLLGRLIRFRNRRSGDDVMKLVQQNELPSVLQQGPRLAPPLLRHRRSRQRVPDLRFAIEDFRLPVIPFVAAMGRVRTPMQLQIQIAVPGR
ncbi:hypothetical protein D1872_280690 [compost metagenome]